MMRHSQTIILVESLATQSLQTGEGEATPGSLLLVTLEPLRGIKLFPFLKSAPKDSLFFSPEYFPVTA